MLSQSIKEQLRSYLANLPNHVELVTWFDDSEASRKMRGMLEDVAGLSTNITVVPGSSSGVRRPAFGLRRLHGHISIVFASVPEAAQFTSFVLAILQVAGVPVRLDQTVKTQVEALDEDLVIETYISFSCHNCADVVQTFNAMAALNPRVKSVVIDEACSLQR